MGLLVEAAAQELKSAGAVPSRAHAPTRAMDDRKERPQCSIALPYRNDAATIFRRFIRSLPTRDAVVGVATCDKVYRR